MTPEDVQRRTEKFSLVRAVDAMPKGHIRVETGLLYPDGSSIDVFVVNGSPPFDKPKKLSDLGQTTAWLLDVQVKPWLSKKRQALLEDAIHTYGVTQSGGALEREIENPDSIAEDILRLAQACLRVADLSFTKRSSAVTLFSEKVEEFLNDSELSYAQNVELVGRYSKPIRVDYLVSGKKENSALLALSSAAPSGAHTLVNEIFRKWYDLEGVPSPGQRVTVWDDSTNVYKEDDLKRLGELSTVLPLSDEDDLRELLAA